MCKMGSFRSFITEAKANDRDPKLVDLVRELWLLSGRDATKRLRIKVPVAGPDQNQLDLINTLVKSILSKHQHLISASKIATHRVKAALFTKIIRTLIARNKD